MNHLALDILIAILIKNEEGGALEDLVLITLTAVRSSPGEVDENETTLPAELHMGSDGKR